MSYNYDSLNGEMKQKLDEVGFGPLASTFINLSQWIARSSMDHTEMALLSAIVLMCGKYNKLGP